MRLEVLLIDEVSMIDKDIFDAICEALSIIDHSRRPNARAADCFGPVHILLIGLHNIKHTNAPIPRLVM